MIKYSVFGMADNEKNALSAERDGKSALRSAAFSPDQWVDAHADYLYRYALTRLRRREDAEDAVQETLLAALRAHQDFRGDSTERTWLISILRHKVVDRVRVATRMDAVEPITIGNVDEWCSTTDRWLHAPKTWSGDPAMLSENSEFWQQVRACFCILSERQALVFSLRTFDNMDAEDICKHTGVSSTNLWVLLHRARTRLRTCMEASYFCSENCRTIALSTKLGAKAKGKYGGCCG